MGDDTTGSYAMKNARVHTKGFTLIASLLMLLLLSGIAIGLMMMVNTEGKVGGTDLQNNIAYHAAEGGIEKMYSDLANVFQNAMAPTPSEICAVSGTSYQPVMMGVTWQAYSVAPSSGCSGTLTAKWGTISSGPNAGLWAQIIPVNMLATASVSGAQEVSMSRTAQVALIPVFQFGVFSESDLSFFSGPNFDMAGPVHTNADLYPFVGPGSTLTFHNKVSAFGNVVRTQLANGWNANNNYNGTVYIPTTNNGCTPPVPPATTPGACQAMDAPNLASLGDGSVTGAGSAAAQTGSTYIPTLSPNTWTPFSATTVNYELVNGNFGDASPANTQGTGASDLKMPFVSGTTFPYQIIRRPPATEDPQSALAQSREYNLAQIHVLLSDDPLELSSGGSGDTQNVRLANVNQTSTTVTQYGVALAAGNYGPTFTVSPPYNLYFATGSNGVVSSCSNAGTCTTDWPYPPAPWTATLAAPSGSPVPLLISNTAVAAPYDTAASIPTLTAGSVTNLIPPSFIVCPNNTVMSNKPLPADVPANCPPLASRAAPYFYINAASPGNIAIDSATSATVNNQFYQSASWNLIDGWLRVEYKNASGTWVPVTNEWLALGFARDVTAPTANGAGSPAGGTKNPINPNAILLLQEPADRISSTAGTVPAPGASMNTATWNTTTWTPPTCTATAVSGGTTYCTAWWAAPPPALLDTGSTYWQFGRSAPSAQSVSQYNWYPINIYDTREGEARDNAVADNSCSTNGVMNAVEIDVGNLKRWLAGSIGSSGASVDSIAQNGYVLYFSDRRGMLLNANAPLPNAPNTKSGDSGLEDVMNASNAEGTPDGALEPTPTGRTVSPEDVNGNGSLDNFGPASEGLGFYGTVLHTTKNLNNQINGTAHPDPFGTDAAGDTNNRMASCSATGRKNWVSGARHALRLVDGSLGNVPLNSGGTITDPGGFTVASENPVYIWGDYNSNPTDTVWNSPPVDILGHSSAAVISDAVTFLSDSWSDYLGFGIGGDGTVTNPGNRNANNNAFYRVAIAGGKNINFPQPGWAGVGQDFGTDGGVHNFLRYLENWNSTLNYKGSIVSLYYATYATGVYKCCNVVYNPPTRNYSFDIDFASPSGLPPGTPMFRDVESLGYRQLFATR